MKDDLIARLEVATGPDRGLDLALYETVTMSLGHSVSHDEEGFRVQLKGDDSFFTVLPSMVLRYTAAIDAALTLVPEGRMWSVTDPANADGHRSVFGYPCRCRASVEGSPNQYDYAATPALALCIAALRARAGDE